MTYKYIGTEEQLIENGYKLGQNTTNVSYNHYGKVFDKQRDNMIKINGNIKNFIFIIDVDWKESKKIRFELTTKTALRCYSYENKEVIAPYIQDLIDKGLVEVRDEIR